MVAAKFVTVTLIDATPENTIIPNLSTGEEIFAKYTACNAMKIDVAPKGNVSTIEYQKTNPPEAM